MKRPHRPVLQPTPRQQTVAPAPGDERSRRAAERASEIDVPRAQAAKDRAEKTLYSNAPDIDYSTVQDALKRAEVRLEVAAKR